MRYGLTILALAAVLCLGTAGPSVAATETGGQTGTLARFGAGANVLGFGGAVVSLAHDPVSVLINPSGAALGRNGKFVASHTALPMDRTVNVIGFGRQIDPRAGFAITWINAGVDGLVRYDENGDAQGSLDNSENAVAFTFGTTFEKFLFGVSAKWYEQSLDSETASNWLLSIGGTFVPAPNLRIGLSIRDVGGDLTWFTERSQGTAQFDDPYPRTIAAGISYTLPVPGITVAANYENVETDGKYAHLGLSWHVMERLQLRAGYRWINIGDASHEPAITGGATVFVPFGDGNIGIDYAAMQDVFGLAHTIGLRFDI